MRTILILMLSVAPLAAMELQILTPPTNTTSFGRILTVSTDGTQMAGEAIVLAGLGSEAVTWSATGGMTFVAISPTDPAFETATGVSTDGRVIAGWQRTGRNNGFVRRTGSSSPTLVNFKDYKVHALSRDGTLAVGTDCTAEKSRNYNAARWDTSSGSRSTVADLAGGATDAAFLAVSADKTTCVGYGHDANGRVAVRSVNGGALTVVGDLAGGKVFAEALGVSTNGGVIVGRSLSAMGMEAFRWTSTGGMTGLGDLPGGAFVSEATSTSDEGDVVVGLAESELGPEVFVWTLAQGMRSLRTVASAGGLDLSGWQFAGAWPVVSGNGDVLAVNAIDPGQAPRFVRLSGLRTAVAGTPAPAVACASAGGNFRVRFVAEPGLRYQLQSVDSLDAGATWQNVGSVITGDGSGVEVAAPADRPSCFFRLVVQ